MTYTGDLSPTDAASVLAERDDAVLLDVRTEAEWSWVGVPAIENMRFVEWVSWPSGERNPRFVAEATGGLDPEQPVVIICRSGGRSAAAADVLTDAGFVEVYNVLEGFEGDLDEDEHRTGGWRGAGLPWRQG
ncbi:MAG: rhodanese-like domain-containing protein [Acidimicrobiales bacterium]